MIHKTETTGDLQVPEPPLRFLRQKEVSRLTGMSRTALYQAMYRGEFPEFIKLNGKSVAWVESEIMAWMKDRMERFRGPKPSETRN